jgi:hypothetical protein
MECKHDWSTPWDSTPQGEWTKADYKMPMKGSDPDFALDFREKEYTRICTRCKATQRSNDKSFKTIKG